MRARKGIILLVLTVLCSPALTAGIPDKPYPERLVNDLAGIFTETERSLLENELVAFDDTTSNQIAVITVRDLEGYDVSEYALKIGNKWGVGASRNNGIVILLKPRGVDRYIDVTIQTGYGLEGAIPDVVCSRIIRNIMGPHLSNDEYFPAVYEAVQELKARACGEIKEARESDDIEEIIWAFVTLIIVIIVFIAVIAASKKNRNGGGNGNSSGGGGRTIIFWPGFGGGIGGGSRGGGFGGGFGGFGGGSFGGGGASGRF